MCLLLVDFLSAQNPLTLTITPANPKICSGSTIIMQATGASSYTWSPGLGLSGTGNGATIAASPMVTTTYTVVGVSGASSGTITVTITVDTVMSIDITPKNVTLCPSQSVVLTARSAANSYTWSPSTGISSTSGSTVSVSPPATQTYTVSGSDALGCTGSNTITINVAQAPNASAGNTQTITCSSTAATLAASGGASYAWSGPHIVTGTNTANPVVNQAGVYTVTVTSVEGCTATSHVNVVQNTAAPSLTVCNTQTLACSPHTAVLSATTSPSAVSYSWTGNGITSSPVNSSVSVDQPGTYYVTVTNPVNGCQSSAMTSAVNAPGVPTATISTPASSGTITCSNPTVTLQANASPAGGVTYQWSIGGSAASVPVTMPGVITLSVTNTSSGCTISTAYTVTSNVAHPALSAQDTVSISCITNHATLQASSGTGNVFYSWTGPNPGSIVSGVNTASPTVISPGNYTVTVTDATNGCSTYSVVSVTGHPVHAGFTANPSLGAAPLNVGFNNTSTNATGYNWYFGDGYLSSATNPTYVYTSNGTYTVMLVASHGACKDTAYAVITVEDPFGLTVPNVFTPNNDGKNDVFYISSYGLKEISLTIYNRWGNVVYDVTSQNPTWDGNLKGGGKADEGTYFYVLDATSTNGDKVSRKGNIDLFR